MKKELGLQFDEFLKVKRMTRQILLKSFQKEKNDQKAADLFLASAVALLHEATAALVFFGGQNVRKLIHRTVDHVVDEAVKLDKSLTVSFAKKNKKK